MAASPQWKVFNELGEYVAACKYFEDAAAVVGMCDKGATIRLGHAKKYTLWIEGIDGLAGDSYDHCTEVCLNRIDAMRKVRGY